MIKFELPIYWYESKRKKSLISMNKYRNYSHFTSNSLKKHVHSLVSLRLREAKISRIAGRIEVRYRLYYLNSRCDMMNIVAVIDKCLLDALKNNGVITDDNVKQYVRCTSEVAGQDRKNPRLEIEIREMR